VLDLAERHREDLARHETQLAQTQQALVGATLRHRALDQVHDRQQQRVGQAQAQQAQKQQDELATQVWWRGRAAAG
jgi:flagellar biosynthesis chaperone FliJ